MTDTPTTAAEMRDARRELKGKLDFLTETVTEIGHWNNEPAGSDMHTRFHEAADELADALYDAWTDGLLMVRPLPPDEEMVERVQEALYRSLPDYAFQHYTETEKREVAAIFAEAALAAMRGE